MIRVLFVCLGNICRSPLAEAIFNEKIAKRGLSHRVQADSCGTANYNVGDPPDPRTVESARKNGIRIRHVARQLELSDLENFDQILVMDANNLRNAQVWSRPHTLAKIKRVRAFDPLGEGDIPDPYYGNENDFQKVFEMLDRCLEKFIVTLIGEASDGTGK